MGLAGFRFPRFQTLFQSNNMHDSLFCHLSLGLEPNDEGVPVFPQKLSTTGSGRGDKKLGFRSAFKGLQPPKNLNCT